MPVSTVGGCGDKASLPPEDFGKDMVTSRDSEPRKAWKWPPHWYARGQPQPRFSPDSPSGQAKAATTQVVDLKLREKYVISYYWGMYTSAARSCRGLNIVNQVL
jgi:hypothetical protein